MKTPALRALIIAGAAGAVLWVWYLLRMEPAIDVRLLPPMPPGRMPLSKTGGPPAAGEAGKDGAPVPLDPAILARMEQWLENRGRDAAGLIALYDVTGRTELLHEAAGNWPYDPLVSLGMVRHLRDDPAKALPWIEQFLDAEPKNPEGYFLLHWALAAAGDHRGALEALRQAVAMCKPAVGYAEPRDTHQYRRAYLVRNAVRESGLDEGPAHLFALFNVQARGGLLLATDHLYQTCLNEMRTATASGDPARQHNTIHMIMDLTDLIGRSSGLSAEEELRVTVLKSDAVRLLPDDTPIRAPLYTAGQIRESAEQHLASLQEIGFTAPERRDFLANASESFQAGYVRHFLSYGERSAAQWLRKEIDSQDVADSLSAGPKATQAPSTSTQRSP